MMPHPRRIPIGKTAIRYDFSLRIVRRLTSPFRWWSRYPSKAAMPINPRFDVMHYVLARQAGVSASSEGGGRWLLCDMKEATPDLNGGALPVAVSCEAMPTL